MCQRGPLFHPSPKLITPIATRKAPAVEPLTRPPQGGDTPAMLSTLSLVAFGGALGASLRFLVGVAVVRVTGPSEFPVAVLGVNILGSFLMGLFVVLAAHKGLTHLSPLVMTGILGGFTTFSTFSLEAVTLIERGALSAASLYIAVSVVGSVLALVAGLWLARGMVL